MTPEEEKIRREALAEGILEGRFRSLENKQAAHGGRLDKHSERMDKFEGKLSIQERIFWGCVGAVFLVKFLPELRGVL